MMLDAPASIARLHYERYPDEWNKVLRDQMSSGKLTLPEFIGLRDFLREIGLKPVKGRTIWGLEDAPPVPDTSPAFEMLVRRRAEALGIEPGEDMVETLLRIVEVMDLDDVDARGE